MTGLIEFLIILIIPFLLALASFYGALEGKRCGYTGTPLLRACGRGLLRGSVVTALTIYLAIIVAAISDSMGRGGWPSMIELLTTGLLVAPVLGFLIALLPAPIAAFIAYNFGARKRAEEEIAQQSLTQTPAPTPIVHPLSTPPNPIEHPIEHPPSTPPNPIEQRPSTLPNPERGAGN